MNTDDINFIFFYISVNPILLRKRLIRELKNNPLRISNNYLKNLIELRSEDKFKFKEILSTFQASGAKVKYFIISNNYSVKNTISFIKNKITYDVFFK